MNTYAVIAYSKSAGGNVAIDREVPIGFSSLRIIVSAPENTRTIPWNLHLARFKADGSPRSRWTHYGYIFAGTHETRTCTGFGNAVPWTTPVATDTIHSVEVNDLEQLICYIPRVSVYSKLRWLVRACIFINSCRSPILWRHRERRIFPFNTIGTRLLYGTTSDRTYIHAVLIWQFGLSYFIM